MLYFIVEKGEELLEYSFQLKARARGLCPPLMYVKAFQFSWNCASTGRNKGEIKMESYNFSSSCSMLDSPQLCFSFLPTTGVRGFVLFLMFLWKDQSSSWLNCRMFFFFFLHEATHIKSNSQSYSQTVNPQTWLYWPDHLPFISSPFVKHVYVHMISPLYVFLSKTIYLNIPGYFTFRFPKVLNFSDCLFLV